LELTSLYSRETPTLPADKAPITKALDQDANDSEYDLYIAWIPREHKIKVNGIRHISGLKSTRGFHEVSI
jgi:hypothetical protein